MNWETIQERGEEWVLDYGPNIIAALLIVLIGWFAAKIATAIVRKLLIRAKLDETIASFMSRIVHVGLLCIVAITALGRLGVATGSFIAIIGAAGLAVGFALQGSLSNFAAGVMLIMFRPFKIGDVVEVGGETGKVKEIHVFSTMVLRPDNKLVTIPNSNITGGNIVNYTTEGTLRVDMVFGIGYDDDIKKAKGILEELVKDDDRILAEPAPQVALSELADSSVNFVVRPWTKTADYWGVKFDFTEKVKLRFDAEGISIPYPQTDVHLHKVEDAA